MQNRYLRLFLLFFSLFDRLQDGDCKNLGFEVFFPDLKAFFISGQKAWIHPFHPYAQWFDSTTFRLQECFPSILVKVDGRFNLLEKNLPLVNENFLLWSCCWSRSSGSAPRLCIASFASFSFICRFNWNKKGKLEKKNYSLIKKKKHNGE